jgi:hypothetical protein
MQQTLLTDDQYKRLKLAEDLIADVQIELLKEDNKLPESTRTGDWIYLYRLRQPLGEFVYNRRPESWPAINIQVERRLASGI